MTNKAARRCCPPVTMPQLQSHQRFVSEIERQIFTVIQSPAQGKTGPHEALFEPKFILFFNTKGSKKPDYPLINTKKQGQN